MTHAETSCDTERKILIPPFPGSNPGAPASDQVIDITL
jgi:hypothetical protein